MRCILGLCVVLAVGSPAWTTEMDLVSLQDAGQVPSVSQTARSSGLPAVTAPSITNQQQAPAQPAPTTASPAPVMTNSGSSAVGAQPVATSTSNTVSPMTYYYVTGTDGRMYLMTTPVYASSPTQTYYTVPQQEVFYQPVRQRRGLLGIFQPRWRQQAVPAYTTTGYTTSGYANAVYVTPGYTTTGFMRRTYTTPVYTPITYYYMPAGNVPASMAPTGVVSSGTAPVATTPVYTPTMFTAPNSTAPAGATPATSTAPAGATPATGTIPSVVKPPAPAVRLPGTAPQ